MTEQSKEWMDKHVVYRGNDLYEIYDNGKFVGVYDVVAAAWKAALESAEGEPGKESKIQ
jgi:hypothetical protein